MPDYYFPRDILSEIFLWLPAKSLAVFSCSVCKLWRDIIIDDVFIAKYTSKSNRYQGKKKVIFLKKYPRSRYNCEPTSRIEYIDWPYENICRFIPSSQRNYDGDLYNHVIYGLCKGLVLFSTEQYTRNGNSKRAFFIVNPSLHMFFPLQTYEFEWNHHYVYHCADIGFDSTSQDYKVLVFPIATESSSRVPIISLYSLNIGSWKDISAKAHYPVDTVKLPYSRPLSVFMNGYVNLVAFQKQRSLSGVNSDLPVILRFDMTGEVFDIMCCPENLDSNYNYFSIAVVSGKVCVCFDASYYYSVWLMNEYGVEESWTKQFQVGASLLGRRIRTILCFYEDGEFLFDCFGKLILYDPKSNKVNPLFPSCDESSLYMGNYEESLVLIDRKLPPTWEPFVSQERRRIRRIRRHY